MSDFIAEIKSEILLLFAAHKQVGLEGEMCLCTAPDQAVWRSEQPDFKVWITPDNLDAGLAELEKHYNNGKLPNSPLLLNPIIHRRNGDVLEPLGAGFAWATGLCLGVADYSPLSGDRMEMLGALHGYVERGEVKQAGLKVLAFADRVLKPTEDGAVEGCRALYDVVDIQSPEYYRYYLLSGVGYLSKNGLFKPTPFSDMFRKSKAPLDMVSPDAAISSNRIPAQRMLDAETCWQAYDRHHSLFRRFGVDVPNLQDNLKYYNLCGRDFQLLDASGAQHADADTSVSFDFIVDGWIPRGAVTIIGATGGTGKSSLAHNLAVKCAIDYAEGEARPNWLGSKINFDKANGMCIYFSGEDGPAIVHSRAKVYDPEGRAHRLMFQRTDFGEGVNFDQFMNRLMKLPDVPLVVIDPARKYLKGDENDAGVVSEFFEAIEEFAIKKNAAMVVVHHLVKGANPKHVSEIYDMLRGSQVFIDRARVVVGMYREGPYTIAGLAKNNIPPQLGMIQGERVFVRDPERLELLWLPGPEGVRNDVLSEEELEALMEEKGVSRPGGAAPAAPKAPSPAAPSSTVEAAPAKVVPPVVAPKPVTVAPGAPGAPVAAPAAVAPAKPAVTPAAPPKPKPMSLAPGIAAPLVTPAAKPVSTNPALPPPAPKPPGRPKPMSVSINLGKGPAKP